MRKIALGIAVCMIFSVIFNSLIIYAENNNEEPYNGVSEDIHMLYLAGALDSNTTYSSSVTEYDNFLEAYYDSLTYNFGVNYKNSCGYIALAMLLSYYDTYLNDSIIPEQYDVNSIGEYTDIISRRNSPGTLRDIIQNPNNINDKTLSEFTASEYYSKMESMSNFSLHAKLITIGSALGRYNFSNSSAPALTNITDLRHIASSFLTNVSEIENTEYTILTSYRGQTDKTSEDIKNSTIEMIQQGYPVLLLVGVPETSIGHFVIAYDYDPDSKSIYCHLGYGANQTHISLDETAYSECWSMLVIDFNTEHSHSNNYGVTTIINNVPNTEYYCYDNCNIITYINKGSEHNYTNSYDTHSTNQHKAYCECGEYILEEHSSRIDDCTLCGEPHTHDYSDHYSRVSGSQHRSYCACGASKLSAHVTRSGSGVLNNRVCIFCLATVEEGFSIILSTSQLPHTENGSYILPSGIIVLVDEDIEAYMSGTLEFIYPDEDEVA